MSEAAPNLRLVGDTAVDTFPWPDTGELVSFTDATYRIRDLTDERDGLLKLTAKQARENAALQRRVAEDADPATHPQGAEIVTLIERWRAGAGHPQARISADRVKLVKARIKDGYPLTAEEWLPPVPTLELAVDGICSHPFVTNGRRTRDGQPSNRHDRLGICLGGGEKVEEFARLGYAARKAGWTPEKGWPT